MSQEILGRVRPVYQGEYDETKTYSFMDRVFYNNNVYEALRSVSAGVLPTNAFYWCILQEKGLKGEKGDTGDPGYSGVKGAKGPQGPRGLDGDMPSHSWSGTILYIQNTDGSLDNGTNLKGPKGLKGLTGDEGNQVELSDAIDSTDKTKAASSYAVKLAYDYAISKETPISDAIDSDSSTTGASSKAVKNAADQSSLGQFFLIGSIMPFNGSFGGTDNRFPIPVGSTEPDTGWVLCDGVETNGITVPDLRSRFIRGGNGTNTGNPGGSDTHSHSMPATGATTVSVAQLPSHAHNVGSQTRGGSYSAGGESMADRYTLKGYSANTGVGSYTSGSHSHSASTSSSYHTWPPCYTLAFIMKIA